MNNSVFLLLLKFVFLYWMALKRKCEATKNSLSKRNETNLERPLSFVFLLLEFDNQ